VNVVTVCFLFLLIYSRKEIKPPIPSSVYLISPLQIRFASVDMELHTTYDPSGSESIYDVNQRVAERSQVLAPLPEDRFLCSFSHIFAGLPCCQTFYFIQIISNFTFSFILSIMCRWLCCWILQLQGNVYLSTFVS
jgi:hypothetical protein